MTFNMPRWAASSAGIIMMLCALAAHAQSADAVPHFEITRFDVQGNTLLPGGEIDQLLTPYTGKNRDFGTVQKALEALEAAYRQKGYTLVRVLLPEQELNRGVVQLRVLEAKIGQVKVEGNQHFDDANIRRSLPGLREGASPNLTAVSASLSVANENPAKKTTLQLQNDEQTDQVNALLQVVDEKPWSGGVSLDNTGDEHTGRNRLTAQYQNADIGGLDHVLSLQYTTSIANPDAVTIFGVGYHIPLYAQGDSLDFYGSYSDVDSGNVSVGLLDLAVSGKGTVLGARYNHNLARVGNYDSKLIAGIDYKAFQSDISLAGFPLGSDITLHPASLTYTGSWASATDTINFYASGIHNIPGGSNGNSADFALQRSNANADYSILRYGASYMRVLPQDWQLRLVLNGQMTNDALVSSEQFGAGGASSVRGFDEREIADDQGRSTNAELYTPNLCKGGTQCRVLAFYDTGYVSHNNPLPGEVTQQSIGSVGLGLRLNVDKHLAMQMDYAQVVDASDTTPKGSHRLHFRVLLPF